MNTITGKWIGIKVSSISQRMKPGLPGRPAKGVILTTETRRTQFGDSAWAKVQWTDAQDNTWTDWSPLSDFMPANDEVDGHICGDRSEP